MDLFSVKTIVSEYCIRNNFNIFRGNLLKSKKLVCRAKKLKFITNFQFFTNICGRAEWFPTAKKDFRGVQQIQKLTTKWILLRMAPNVWQWNYTP